MGIKNKQLNIKIFWVYFILAIILFWPFFSDAQESVTLNSLSPGCTGSEAFVNLNWASTISGTPTYYILRGATFTEIGSTQNLFYTDKPVDSDKNYVYKIKSGAVESNEKTALAFYCPPVILPPTTSCAADGPYIALNWSPISGTPSIYEVYRDGVKIGQTSTTTFTDGPNLEGTKTYNYFIRAIWQDGTKKDSDTVPVIAPACPPTLTISADCLNSVPGGPKVNLSWNNLIGVQNYQIYRKTQSEPSFSLLKTLTDINYQDNLVESLSAYGQGGQISYYIKAVWLTDQKDSDIKQITISRCPPFLTVVTNCDEFSFRLSWTNTSNATHYNIYRDGSFLYQNIGNTATSYTDYLDLVSCPGQTCVYNYYVEALVVGLPNISSNSVVKSIDCATVSPPSPPPILAAPATYCVSGDSRIKISWTPSDNVNYYDIYRNGVSITPLLQILYEDSGVESGVVYAYYINAMGMGGSSAISNSQTITAVDCASPSTPTLTLSSGCETGQPYINLDWATTTNTLSYEIYRGPSATNLTLLRTFEKDSPEFSQTFWKNTPLSSSAPYYYKVVAKGPPGVSSTSSDTKAIISQSCLPTTPSLFLTPACEVGNSVVNLFWATDEANTTRYEIFRQDWSLTIPIKIIYDKTIKTWNDISVFQQTTYNYKIEAVGPVERSTQGYKSITTSNCSPPGPFTLNEPNLYCQGSSPRADLSWTSSSNSTSYNLYRTGIVSGQTTTFTNTTSPFTDWGFNNALRFDGSDDYVRVPHSSVLDLGYTVEAWVKPVGLISGQAEGGIVEKLNWTNKQGYFLQWTNDKKISFSVGNGTSWKQHFTLADSVPLDQWSHIVGIYDGSFIRVYINGVSNNNSTAQTGAIAPNTSTLTIGAESSTFKRFNGIIDEVRIYNRVLSPAEITEHYKGIFSDETKLIGLWHFDEGTGQYASDSSNYGNNGTLGSSSSVGPTDPIWVQNELQSGTEYKWQSRAFGPGGDTYSNYTSQLVMPTCPPTKPGFVLTSLCEITTNLSAVKLQWSYTTATTKYEIYRQDKGLIKTINQGDGEFSSRTWTDNNGGAGLNGGTTYIYYIRAIGPTNLSNQSDSISIIAPSCLAPTTPGNLTANFECDGSYPRVKLTWEDSQNATYYTIYRDDGWISDPIADNNSPVYTYYNIYPSAKVNTAYTYAVKAFSPGGESPFSNSASVPSGKFCPLSTPLIKSLITDCESLAPINNLSWSDDTPFNSSAYKIYRNTTGTLPTEADLIKTITSAMPEFSTRIWKDNSGLNNKQQYYYWVRSVGPAGMSILSNQKSVTAYYCGTPPAPFLKLDSLFCKDNSSYATLSWTTNSDATSYNFYRTNPDASSSTYSTRISPLTDKGSFALKFDGINDYAEVKNASSLNNFNAGLTVEAWGKQISYTGGLDTWLLNKDYTGYRIWGLDKLTFWVRTPTQNWIEVLGPTPNLNQWYHLVGVVDNINLKAHLYINGQLSTTVSLPEKYNFANWDLPLILGRHNLVNRFWPGIIDEVRIYGRALSPTEANEHYQGIYKNETELRGAWHLDEEEEEVTLLDSSGNGNNGKIAGPAWVESKTDLGKALEFGGLNGHVNVPHSASFSDIKTFETWFNSKNWETVNSYSSTIFNKYTDSNDMFRIAFDDGASGKIFVSAKKGGVEIGRNGTTGVSLNEWHHLVVVFSNPVKIYLDKINITSAISNTWSRYSGANNLYIGSRGDAGYFNGLIDEVRIYNRTLSLAEITEHYDGIFSDETGLVSLWHFDEESGETAYDSSPFDNDGTLIKGAEWGVHSDAPASIFISALARESLYKYYVKAIGVGTVSGSSNEISFNTPSCQPATPVLVVEAKCDYTTDPPDPQLKLSWQADQNTEYWNVYKSRGEEPSESIVATTLTSYLDGDVESGIDYTYYVTAWGKGVQENSDLITKTVPTHCNSPSKPVFIPENYVTPQCYGYSSRILVNWDEDLTGNTISFNIWRNFSKTYSGLAPTVTQYTDIVEEENIYQYEVEAVGPGENNTIFSDPSFESTALACSALKPNPPVLYLDGIGSTSDLRTVYLHWTDAGNEEYYKVFRSSSEWIELVEIPGNLIPEDIYWIDKSWDRELNDGEIYNYKIIAYNMNGSTESNAVIASIPIARPGSFTLSNSWVDNVIHLIWTEASTTPAGGAVYYKVLQDDSEAFSSSSIICENISVPPFECNNNSSFSKKYYKAVATNNGGSTDSNIVEVEFLLPSWKEISPW